MKKLDSYSPLGYSSAGEVIKVASDVQSFAVGDLVACGGAGYANHAEIIAVPSNLCVKLPEDTDLKRAAYNNYHLIQNTHLKFLINFYQNLLSFSIKLMTLRFANLYKIYNLI